MVFIGIPWVPSGSDEEMDELAEEEEEEALALQKQMAASLEEQDFDADVFEVLVNSNIQISNCLTPFHSTWIFFRVSQSHH